MGVVNVTADSFSDGGRYLRTDDAVRHGLELWAEGTNRFHERLRYTRELAPADAFSFSAGPWSSQRLQP